MTLKEIELVQSLNKLDQHINYQYWFDASQCASVLMLQNQMKKFKELFYEHLKEDQSSSVDTLDI